ncbi:MAG: sulfotransferase family 2 domain-containing protein, partial [Solirubrobacteraceae bacterium]
MLTTDPEPRAGAPFAQHVLQRTVVLPELRVLFLPTPKAGCTSVLWLLADMARIPPATFEHSSGPEPSPALSVHDMRRWPPACRFSELAPEERGEILRAGDWLRFSLVRNPADRLWSAWQSKLLLREPRFVEAFGDAPWFPRVPRLPAEVIEDFRAFVAAVGRGEAHDVHWSVQASLVAQLPLTHLGRVERIADTLERLREHVGEDAWPGEEPRENATPLRLPPGGYDRECTEVLREVYEADFELFGYDEPKPAGVDLDWEERTAALLPLVRMIVEERGRAARIHAVAR